MLSTHTTSRFSQSGIDRTRAIVAQNLRQIKLIAIDMIAIEDEPHITGRTVVMVDGFDRAVVDPRVSASDSTQRVRRVPNREATIRRSGKPVEQAGTAAHDATRPPTVSSTTATMPIRGSTAPACTSAQAACVSE